MADSERTATTADGGPWVQIACLCEHALFDQDGILTVVRQLSQVYLDRVSGRFPSKEEPLSYSAYVAVVLARGTFTGSARVTLAWDPGDGNEVQFLPERTVAFESSAAGIALIQKVNLKITAQGSTWLNLRVDNRLLTRIPFEVTYRERATSPATGIEEGLSQLDVPTQV